MTATENIPKWFKEKYDSRKETLAEYLKRAENELLHDYNPETKKGIKGYSKFKKGTILKIMYGIQEAWLTEHKTTRERPSIIVEKPTHLADINIPKREFFMGVKVQTKYGERHQYPKGTFRNIKGKIVNVSGRFFKGDVYKGYYSRY